MHKLDKIVQIAQSAGEIIMDFYKQVDSGTTFKEDKSPLTLADTAAHNFIARALNDLDPAVPVLSEESKGISYEMRKDWQHFWLVDPLDGTKEFLKRNGEFTVNIALIKKNRPVVGVVYSPAKKIAYYARKGEGAYRKTENLNPEKICVSNASEYPLKVIVSRSHKGGEQETILKRLGEYQAIYSGSSYKFCLVAEGSADLYPRLWPSMEWDTGAGEFVLQEAGGVTKSLDAHKLVYNKEDLTNPYFIASANSGLIELCLR